MSETLLAAGIGLIGAAIGGGCSYFAMWMQIREQRRRDEAEAKRQVRNVIRMWLSSVSLRLLDLRHLFAKLLMRVSFKDNAISSFDLRGVHIAIEEYVLKIRHGYEFDESARFINDDDLQSIVYSEEFLASIEDIVRNTIDIIISIEGKSDNEHTKYYKNMILFSFNQIAFGINELRDRIYPMYGIYNIELNPKFDDLQSMNEVKKYCEQYEQFKKQQAKDAGGELSDLPPQPE